MEKPLLSMNVGLSHLLSKHQNQMICVIIYSYLYSRKVYNHDKNTRSQCWFIINEMANV